MAISPSSQTLMWASERFHPRNFSETFISTKLSEKKALRLLRYARKYVQDDEIVTFVTAPIRTTSIGFAAVTDSRLVAGNRFGLLDAFPLTEIEIASTASTSTWSKTSDTLNVYHLGKRKRYELIPPPDHDVVREFIERARIAERANSIHIFAELAAAREAEFPVPAPAAPSLTDARIVGPSSVSDMADIIAQLKQLGELREAGLLSQADFEQAKARLGFTH